MPSLQRKPVTTPEPQPIKVLAVYRKSTDKQDLATQHSNVEKFCQPGYYKDAPAGLVVADSDVFEFEGITGTQVHKHPDFKRMLRRLETSPDIAGIVISDSSRLMRVEEINAFGKLEVFVEHHKLIFHDAKSAVELWDPIQAQMFSSMLWAAGDARRKMALASKNTKEFLIQDPTINICKLPQGVRHDIERSFFGRKNNQKGWYEYTDFAKSSIRPAFERVAAGGESMSSIATTLGFSNETALRNALRNEWYIGYRVRDKKRVVKYDKKTGKKTIGKREEHETPLRQATNLAGLDFCYKPDLPHEPLVSVELFNRVQNILNKHKETFSEWQTNSGNFLGTGFMVCGVCGCKLYLKYDKRNGKPPVYICSSYQTRWRNENRKTEETKVLPPCNFSRMRAADVDAAIWKAAETYFTDHGWLHAAILEAQKTDVAQDRQADLRAAEGTLEGLEKEKKKVLALLNIDDEDGDVLQKFTDVKRRISEVRIRVATLKANAQPFGSSDAFVIAKAICNRFWNSGNWTTEEKRAALADVVERIRIGQDNKAYFTVRGGLPLQRQGGARGPFDVPPGLTPEQAAKFREDQISLPSELVANLAELP
jgi:hypothetical protein